MNAERCETNFFISNIYAMQHTPIDAKFYGESESGVRIDDKRQPAEKALQM